MRRDTEWNFQETFVRILDERLPGESGGKRKTQSKRDVILAHILQKAIEGNSTLRTMLLDYQVQRSGKSRRQVQPTRNTKKDDELFKRALELSERSLRSQGKPDSIAQGHRKAPDRDKIQKR